MKPDSSISSSQKSPRLPDSDLGKKLFLPHSFEKPLNLDMMPTPSFNPGKESRSSRRKLTIVSREPEL